MRGLQAGLAACQLHWSIWEGRARKPPAYREASAVSSVAGGSAGAPPRHSRAWGALTVPAVGTGRCGAPLPWPSCVKGGGSAGWLVQDCSIEGSRLVPP